MYECLYDLSTLNLETLIYLHIDKLSHMVLIDIYLIKLGYSLHLFKKVIKIREV